MPGRAGPKREVISGRQPCPGWAVIRRWRQHCEFVRQPPNNATRPHEKQQGTGKHRLSEKAIRRGSFVSVPDLQQAIDRFLGAWNAKPKPFVWTATVEAIIKRIERARARLEPFKPGCTLPRGKKTGGWYVKLFKRH